MTNQWIAFGIGAGLSVLLLAVGHWLPLQRTMTLIARYVYGVASLALGFTAWRFLVGDWITPVGMFWISAAGGATVVLAYKYDHWLARRKSEKKAKGPYSQAWRDIHTVEDALAVMARIDFGAAVVIAQATWHGDWMAIIEEATEIKQHVKAMNEALVKIWQKLNSEVRNG